MLLSDISRKLVKFGVPAAGSVCDGVAYHRHVGGRVLLLQLQLHLRHGSRYDDVDSPAEWWLEALQFAIDISPDFLIHCNENI